LTVGQTPFLLIAVTPMVAVSDVGRDCPNFDGSSTRPTHDPKTVDAFGAYDATKRAITFNDGICGTDITGNPAGAPCNVSGKLSGRLHMYWYNATSAKWVDITERKNALPLVVGEKVQLRMAYAKPDGSPGAPPATVSWQIPGPAVAAYDIQDNGPVIMPLTGLDRAEVTFYWHGPSDTQGFAVSGTADGEKVTKDFEVEEPSVTMTAKTCGVGIGPRNSGALAWGLGYAHVCYVNHQEGIHWEAQVTLPNVPDNTGKIALIQLITDQFWHNSQLCAGSTTALQADNQAFYDNKITDAPPGDWKSQDSPDMLLSALKGVSGTVRREFHARDFLMYRPTHGIYVALRDLHWDWSSTIKRNRGKWEIVSGSTSNPPAKPAIKTTTILPTWDGVSPNLSWSKLGCP
jgi:hypothetical protein